MHGFHIHMPKRFIAHFRDDTVVACIPEKCLIGPGKTTKHFTQLSFSEVGRSLARVAKRD